MPTPREQELIDLDAQRLAIAALFNRTASEGYAILGDLAQTTYGEAARDAQDLETAYREKSRDNLQDRFAATLDLIRETASAFQVHRKTTQLLLEPYPAITSPLDMLDLPVEINNSLQALSVIMHASTKDTDRFQEAARLLAQEMAETMAMDVAPLLAEIDTAGKVAIYKDDDKPTLDKLREKSLHHDDAVAGAYITLTREHLDMTALNLGYVGARHAFLQAATESETREKMGFADHMLQITNELAFFAGSRVRRMANLWETPAFKTN